MAHAPLLRWFCALIVPLFLLNVPNCPAGAVSGIGVMGDSVADEYQFASIIEPGGFRPAARGFVEVLSMTRQLNFGPASNADRGTPRGKGFEYNYAVEGDRSADLIAHGQHTGVAQLTAANKVNLAWMFVGGNDFRDLYDPAVITSPDPGAAIQGAVVKLATNVGTAIQTVLTANPSLNLVVANVPDLRSIPGLKAALAANPALVPFAAAVDQGVQAYNAQLKSMVDGNSRLALADAYQTSQAAVAGLPVQVGDLTLDTNIPGVGADHYFVDAIHPGTAASGILANLFLDASNSKFDTGFSRLSDSEIAGFARTTAANAIPLPPAVYTGGLTLAVIGSVSVVTRMRRTAA